MTQAVLLLDALILAYVRGERRAYERRTLLVLASALILFAAEAVREPGTVLNAPRGIAFWLSLLPHAPPPTRSGSAPRARMSISSG